MKRLIIVLALGCIGSHGNCASCIQAAGAIAQVTASVGQLVATANQQTRARALAKQMELMNQELSARAEIAELRDRARTLPRDEPPGEARLVRRAAAAPILALFDLTADEPAETELARVLTDRLYLELVAAGGAQLIPLERVRAALLEAEAEHLERCTDESCQLGLGKALAAQKVVVPVLYATGEQCILGITIYDLTRETAEWARSVRTDCNAESLARAAHQLAAQLRKSGD